MKRYDVVAVCNALVDILLTADDKDLTQLSLTKGIMHLVDGATQHEILAKFHDHEKTIEIGGSAMNAVRAMAALGSKTFFAGMVASDPFGQKIKERMEELGIEFHLGQSSEKTGSCLILVTPDGERTLLTHLGASRMYGVAEIPDQQIRQAKVLHFCGYQWDTENQKEAIKSAISSAKESDTLVSFDVADPFVVDRYREDFRKLISEQCDIVFANREEARMLYDQDGPQAASEIAKTGAIAVIKMGAEGALVQKGDEFININPIATRVIDTTAAGDMFAGGFLSGFTQGLSLKKCGDMAAILASDVISRMGAKLSSLAIKGAGDVAKG